MAPLLIPHGLRSPGSPMTTEHVLINCEQDGEAYATFVCAHLAAEPLQEWLCDYPTEDNTWTDSWCAQCNSEFEKQARWERRKRRQAFNTIAAYILEARGVYRTPDDNGFTFLALTDVRRA